MTLFIFHLFFHHVSGFLLFFFFNDTATTEIYTLSLHDALPILAAAFVPVVQDLLSTFGTAIEPTFTRIVYLILLPLGYIAAFIVEFLAPILARFWRREPVLLQPRTPADDEELLR